MELISSFGERMKQYRLDNKYTLAEIEQLTGVPAPTINRYELGQRIPKLDLATLIAHQLQLNPLWLFGYDVDTQYSCRNDSMNLTNHEQAVLTTYRTQPETQHAIDYILEKPEHCEFVNQYALLNERDQDRITERMETLLEDEKYSPKAKASLA